MHGTYFDSSRTHLTDSGIYYLSSIIWVCGWLFYKCIEGWRPWVFFSLSSFQHNSTAKGPWSMHRTTGLRDRLYFRVRSPSFLIYKCLVVLTLFHYPNFTSKYLSCVVLNESKSASLSLFKQNRNTFRKREAETWAHRILEDSWLIWMTEGGVVHD